MINADPRTHRTSRLSWKAIALIWVLPLAVSGCEYFYLHHTDCRYYDGPRFDRISLNRLVLNQQYFDRVRISLDDDSYINSYNFWLEISGRLPPGITANQENRSVVFEGTATSLGTYSFTIIAVVEYKIYDRYYYGYYRDICNYRTTQNYQLIVEPT